MTNLLYNTELSPDGESIVYILEHRTLTEQDTQHMAWAQQVALQLALPIAVAVVVEETDASTKTAQLHVLAAAERELGRFNIPLITLLGDPLLVLPALVHHVRPRILFNQYHNLKASSLSLKEHPYAWPGSVISTKQLVGIVENGEATCS